MAAKIAGVDFDTLNGYVTAIGESTRQTGKEIGTSLKFIFSRLHTQKAPATLRSIAGVETTQGGNIRAGKDIIADLASTWDTLSESQKIAIAQAMGGIRQYNAVMVLMENYGRAMEAAAKSANSLGSAERENQIVMETTAKKYAQLKATIQEVYIELKKRGFFSNQESFFLRPTISPTTTIPGGFRPSLFTADGSSLKLLVRTF